ncbi:hypothetical protein EDD80_12024 [Anseongella ginsenosidimutans]|uniref:VOC domain-containing protein n=1 Tax=Anseongella ginsenosidimutans TaxID=496056 RepID=A0A4R3KLZ8_9SPHI|nr:VOC family protein [Anseongella ginsenosidimutans]QEC53587.1 glyoxalase [Anseongella ginsenosidimutans]TCS84658.1 hypothetical protein EDD80_12024 [Anseongella ginsenosidimutans]
MTPQMIWANLGVSDLERTTKFYTALGFKANCEPNGELTSFLFGKNNFVMHFFLRDVLKANLNSEISDSHQANEVVFTLSAETKDQVDTWAKEVKEAGGKVVSKPEAFGEGYYGFVFTDPDGHKFNVFYM